MKNYFDELEKTRNALLMSIESVAKLIGVQPITYAHWVGGTQQSNKFLPQIANGFLLLSVLRFSGLIPSFKTERERNHFYKTLTSKAKLHALIKTFCYSD